MSLLEPKNQAIWTKKCLEIKWDKFQNLKMNFRKKASSVALTGEERQTSNFSQPNLGYGWSGTLDLKL